MPWLKAVEIKRVESKVVESTEILEWIKVEEVAKVMLENVRSAKWIY